MNKPGIVVLGLPANLVQSNRQQEVPQIAGVVDLELSIRGSAKERAKGRLQHVAGFESSLQVLTDPALDLMAEALRITLVDFTGGILVSGLQLFN